MSKTLPIAAACAMVLGLGGCGTLDRFSTTEGGIGGAGVGTLAGAAVSGGVIVPVIGAASGAVIGSELAEPDPAKSADRDAIASNAATGDLFARLDDDRNGWLDAGELRDSASVDRDWRRFDRNGDDRVDRAEFDAIGR